MGNNTTAFIDVQFDMGDANEQLSTMRTAMDGLGKIANRFSIALVDAFSPISICIEGIKDEVVSLGDSIETSVKQLAEVKSADNPATKSASLFDSISGAYDAVLQGVKKIEEIEKNSGKLINPFEEIVTYLSPCGRIATQNLGACRNSWGLGTEYFREIACREYFKIRYPNRRGSKRYIDVNNQCV